MDNPYYDKIYRAICSEKTLQSNAKGFFMDFVDFVVNQVGDNKIKNEFGKLKSDKDRVKFVYEDEMTRTSILGVLTNVQPVFRKKDAEFSRNKRIAAIKISESDLKKSLALFSQSVLRAPKTGETKSVDEGISLALALWERSKVLIKLNKFSEAFSDIQLCLKEGISNSYKAEIYWKMGICCQALNDKKRADVSFDLAQKLLKNEKEIQKLQSDRTKTFICDTSQQNKRRELPNFNSTRNKTFPNASSKIKIMSSKELGKYVVANNQISTGDPLVVEDPYVACLLPEKFGTHCHHCFDRLNSPIGCPNCSGVAFCNVKCRDEALQTYHQYECKFLDLLIGSGMSILAHAALRSITQNTLENNLKIYKNKANEQIYTLCTNDSLRTTDDFFQRTLMTCFLLEILKKSKYLDNDKNNELIIAEMLLFYLQILQFNTHEVYETLHTAQHRFRETKADYIGVALYPTASYFNHDCFPGVSRHFFGKKIVLQASRPFQINQAIPENYGPIFTRKTLPERQRSLVSRYWFTCKCDACTNNWPMVNKGLENVSGRVKCATKTCDNFFHLPIKSSTDIMCPKCKENVSLSNNIMLLEWCKEQFKYGFQKMDEDQAPDKAVDILSVALNTFYKISLPPNQETQLAEETLRICLADSGNVYETLVKNKK